MECFFDTERYVLVPYDFHSTGKERTLLSQLHDVGNDDVRTIDIPSLGAAFIYASPDSEDGSVPAACLMLNKLQEVKETHKLMVRFSESLVTVVLSDREHLLFANSFKVSSFADSLYFIMAALKEAVFEPEHTVIHFSGKLSREESELLDRYFPKKVAVEL